MPLSTSDDETWIEPRNVRSTSNIGKPKIEWTDATWNPITGCSVVSRGCANCYAMKLAGTRLGWLVSETLAAADQLVGDMHAQKIDVSAQLQIGEDAYCCALGWPHFLEQLSGAGNVDVVRGGDIDGRQLQLKLDCKPRP